MVGVTDHFSPSLDNYLVSLAILHHAIWLIFLVARLVDGLLAFVSNQPEFPGRVGLTESLVICNSARVASQLCDVIVVQDMARTLQLDNQVREVIQSGL